MADLHAWRNAATELPPEGVPVWGMDDLGSVSMYEIAKDDDGALVWAVVPDSVWWHASRGEWGSESAFYDDIYPILYWHPLPDVPTLAELDAAHGAHDHA